MYPLRYASYFLDKFYTLCPSGYKVGNADAGINFSNTLQGTSYIKHFSNTLQIVSYISCLKSALLTLQHEGHDTGNSSWIWSIQTVISCSLGTSHKLRINFPYYALRVLSVKHTLKDTMYHALQDTSHRKHFRTPYDI